jgi:hypothetical protein
MKKGPWPLYVQLGAAIVKGGSRLVQELATRPKVVKRAKQVEECADLVLGLAPMIPSRTPVRVR